VRLSAGAFVAGTTALGAAVLAMSGALVARLSPGQLALLGAAVVVTELLQVNGDDESLDPSDAQTFSFSSGVHIAAILTMGPWAAALAAAFGVLVVDRLRGSAWRKVAFNAAAFALAAASAEAGLGVAFAFAALENPWLILALVPLALAVYFAHARLTQLRRETLYALETFANVVDERDPYTYRHSQRVAEHVRELAE